MELPESIIHHKLLVIFRIRLDYLAPGKTCELINQIYVGCLDTRRLP